jgi:hypothetical protein
MLPGSSHLRGARAIAEFRGVVERIEEDPGGVFYETLAKRSGAPWGYPGDPRVILLMKIQHIAGQNL